METDILIVGGGLAGLSLARRLSEAGRDWHLLEARPRLGGRILTRDGGFDLGPSWFWPGQPLIATLITELGLGSFEQYYQGDTVQEDAEGRVHRGRGFASMRGAFRVAGGMGAVTSALANQLAKDRVRVAVPVSGFERRADSIGVRTSEGIVTARHVVLAMPPRIAADLPFAPALPPELLDGWRSVPTWMGGHAKAMILFDTPFWRKGGLSGDAMSRRGPLVEIHDAGPLSGGPGALFGFVGVPHQARQNTDALKHAIRNQLARLFGSAAAHPRDILIQDWAGEPYTATEIDRNNPFAHPGPGDTSHLTHWDGQLRLAGTEVAPRSPGLVEGALESAADAIKQLCEIERHDHGT